ncbi:hypothetical protein [Nocardia pseudovaccinii]|uniref:hypothetical protein n=1 Tax=Nocardia pseudovaccinii TaxID=189540 RepID=UPI0007A37061|nr:hypothetical protein [Nocardia pseudovaccinii]
MTSAYSPRIEQLLARGRAELGIGGRGSTPKLGELSIALVDHGDRYVLTDSHPDGMRVHIGKPATAEAVNDAIREAIAHNSDWIADALTTNLPNDEETETDHDQL